MLIYTYIYIHTYIYIYICIHLVFYVRVLVAMLGGIFALQGLIIFILKTPAGDYYLGRGGGGPFSNRGKGLTC